MFTVVLSSRSKLNVSPAGTVNELMFTVVHLTAEETSSMDEMVPVHAEDASDFGAAAMSGKATESSTNARESAIGSLTSRRSPGGAEVSGCAWYSALPP